ncbi:MAG TPA: arylsulfotransferase family protein [Solirubrobacteraceae bacterium]|nr:arylsulfotransferase family protein [Solirubrobacteraceae bacterium]
MLPGICSAAVTISPLAGTPDATPATQISILGTAASNVESVTATGSISGVHLGTIESYLSSPGASFIPELPFTEGEEVHVVVHLREGSPLEDSFTVAHLGPGEELLHQTTEKPEDQEHFVTEPELRPPKVTITTADPSLEGDLFTDPIPAPEIHPGEKKLLEFEPVGPNGLMILNPEGKLLYWRQFKEEVGSVFEPVQYEGKTALAWWQGKVTEAAYGLGEGVIANTAYEPIAYVKAGNGQQADIHEFYVTPEGQAYIVAVEPVCQPECNEEHVPLLDDEIQEIDIKTGLVMWSWNALGHVPVENTEAVPSGGVFDPYHLNSVQAISEHRVVISMRDTSGVYEVDQNTGKVLWEISPSHNTFKLKRGVLFHFQHDARLYGKHLETLSLFDDEAGPPLYGPSKGLILRIKGKTVKLVHAYESPRRTLAVAEGGMQVLPGGEALVSFGATQYISEFSKNGERKKNGKLLFEAELPKGDGTYRAMRFPWSGTPDTKPAVVAKRESAEEVAVYVSWNGATEIAKWEVLAGEEPSSLSPVTTSDWSNFETRIPVSSTDRVFEVKALDKEGKVLSTSEAVDES